MNQAPLYKDIDWSLEPGNGGVNVLFCDGRVRFVSENINSGTWQALGHKSDSIVTGEY